jgi:hypothetical protein
MTKKEFLDLISKLSDDTEIVVNDNCKFDIRYIKNIHFGSGAMYALPKNMKDGQLLPQEGVLYLQ